MNIRLLIPAVLVFSLQSCAAPQEGLDIDHNAPAGEQSEAGDDRGFDPCKLNKTLPVCDDA